MPASIHHSDAMETTHYDALNNVFYNHSQNSAMINRLFDRGSAVFEMQDWNDMVNSALDLKATCGLALRTEVVGDDLQIDVHAGFSAPQSGDLYVSVYLLEDDVTGTGPMYDQLNFFHQDANHPFYNSGSPIQGFHHNRVLREVVSAGMGDLLNPSRVKAGDSDLKKYFVDISSYNAHKSNQTQTKLTVIAFIHRIGVTADDFSGTQRTELPGRISQELELILSNQSGCSRII